MDLNSRRAACETENKIVQMGKDISDLADRYPSLQRFTRAVMNDLIQLQFEFRHGHNFDSVHCSDCRQQRVPEDICRTEPKNLGFVCKYCCGCKLST